MLLLRRNYLASGKHACFTIHDRPYNNSPSFTYNNIMSVVAQCYTASDSTSPDLVYLGLGKLPWCYIGGVVMLENFAKCIDNNFF